MAARLSLLIGANNGQIRPAPAPPTPAPTDANHATVTGDPRYSATTALGQQRQQLGERQTAGDNARKASGQAGGWVDRHVEKGGGGL